MESQPKDPQRHRSEDRTLCSPVAPIRGTTHRIRSARVSRPRTFLGRSRSGKNITFVQRVLQPRSCSPWTRRFNSGPEVNGRKSKHRSPRRLPMAILLPWFVSIAYPSLISNSHPTGASLHGLYKITAVLCYTDFLVRGNYCSAGFIFYYSWP